MKKSFLNFAAVVALVAVSLTSCENKSAVPAEGTEDTLAVDTMAVDTLAADTLAPAADTIKK